MHKPTIKVIVDKEVYEFDNLICTGSPTGNIDNPTSFYFGTRDIGELGVNLMYLLRSILKISSTEYEMRRGAGEELVKECLREAVRRELYDRGDQTVTRRVFDQK